MYYLDDFVVGIKRDCAFGTTSVTSDRATADIIRSLVRHCKRVAKRWPWDWLIKLFDVNVTAAAQNITLDADIDRIWGIGDNNSGRLKKVSIKQMLDWHTPASSEADTNVVGYFCHIGRDTTTGARIIRVLGNPSSAAVLPAYCLKKFTPLTVADIATPANFLPFPDEVIDVIGDFVRSDVERIQGKMTWETHKKLAQEDLTELIGDEQSDPSDDVTTPLPDYYRKKRNARRSGKVV